MRSFATKCASIDKRLYSIDKRSHGGILHCVSCGGFGGISYGIYANKLLLTSALVYSLQFFTL